jgi:hypothetical protein
LAGLEVKKIELTRELDEIENKRRQIVFELSLE